jgi:hypothetical protein
MIIPHPLVSTREPNLVLVEFLWPKSHMKQQNAPSRHARGPDLARWQGWQQRVCLPRANGGRDARTRRIGGCAVSHDHCRPPRWSRAPSRCRRVPALLDVHLRRWSGRGGPCVSSHVHTAPTGRDPPCLQGQMQSGMPAHFLVTGPNVCKLREKVSFIHIEREGLVYS